MNFKVWVEQSSLRTSSGPSCGGLYVAAMSALRKRVLVRCRKQKERLSACQYACSLMSPYYFQIVKNVSKVLVAKILRIMLIIQT